MAKTEQVTKYNASAFNANGEQILNKEGENEYLYLSEDTLNKRSKEVKDAGGTVDVTLAQTFTITEAESIDELGELFPQRALEFANYGGRLAQQNYMRDWMREEGQTGQEGSIDLAPLVQEAKVRQKASPRDKAIAILAKDTGLDRAAIEAFLAQFAAEQASKVA